MYIWLHVTEIRSQCQSSYICSHQSAFCKHYHVMLMQGVNEAWGKMLSKLHFLLRLPVVKYKTKWGLLSNGSPKLMINDVLTRWAMQVCSKGIWTVNNEFHFRDTQIDIKEDVKDFWWLPITEMNSANGLKLSIGKQLKSSAHWVEIRWSYSSQDVQNSNFLDSCEKSQKQNSRVNPIRKKQTVKLRTHSLLFTMSKPYNFLALRYPENKYKSSLQGNNIFFALLGIVSKTSAC